MTKHVGKRVHALADTCVSHHQFVDSRKRVTGAHVAYESKTWAPAFNLDLGVFRVMWELVQHLGPPPLPQDSSLSAAQLHATEVTYWKPVVSACVEAVVRWRDHQQDVMPTQWETRVRPCLLACLFAIVYACWTHASELSFCCWFPRSSPHELGPISRPLASTWHAALSPSTTHCIASWARSLADWRWPEASTPQRNVAPTPIHSAPATH